MLRPWQRTALSILNVVPVPGVGAMWAGWRNPHTLLVRNGFFQFALVLFGAWPLVVPGAVGLGWALWDAMRIAQAAPLELPPKNSATPHEQERSPK